MTEARDIRQDRDLARTLGDALQAMDLLRDHLEKDPAPWTPDRTANVELLAGAQRLVCRSLAYVQRRRRFVDGASLEEGELAFDLARRAIAGFLFELHDANPYTISMAFLVDWAEGLERRDPDAMEALRQLVEKLEPDLSLPPRRMEVLDVEGHPVERRRIGGGEPDVVCHWCGGAALDASTVRTGATGTYCSLKCDVAAATARADENADFSSIKNSDQARELVESTFADIRALAQKGTDEE